MDDQVCRKCQKGNSPEAIYCMHCGTKLHHSAKRLNPLQELEISDQADLTALKTAVREAWGVEDIRKTMERVGQPYSEPQKLVNLDVQSLKQAFDDLERRETNPSTKRRVVRQKQALIRFYGLDGKSRRNYEDIRTEVGATTTTPIREWVRMGTSSLVRSLG